MLQILALVEKMQRNKIIAQLGNFYCLAKTVSQPGHMSYVLQDTKLGLAWWLSLTDTSKNVPFSFVNVNYALVVIIST